MCMKSMKSKCEFLHLNLSLSRGMTSKSEYIIILTQGKWKSHVHDLLLAHRNHKCGY